MDALTTDETLWPVVIHSTVGIPSDDDVNAFVRRADAILARRERHVVIFDNRRAGRASTYMRSRCLEWLRASAPLLSEHCAGTALVSRSAALRFLMTTVVLASAYPMPHEVCATLPEAIRWAHQQLARPRRAVG